MLRKIAIVIITKIHDENNTCYSSHINLQYANKHKYDFFIEHAIDDENKLLICTKYLPNYHYVLFITDSNIIFKNEDLSLEPIIDKYISDTQVIALSTDWNEHFLKSKVLLIKNCLLSFEILNYWNNYADIIDELDIAYEIYTDRIISTKFDIFENANNLWSTYFYSNKFISKNIIIIGFLTSILFCKFVIKF
jgi:hypothetical protein